MSDTMNSRETQALSMIERVRTVIASRDLDRCQVMGDCGGIYGPCYCKDTARLVIEAMREPTEEMIEGGHYSDRPTFHHENYGAWFAERQRVETIYRAMIGKALGE